MGFDHFALFFQRQLAARVGQRVDHHGGVLTRFHHFIQIADRAVTRCHGQGAVLPARAVGIEQETSDQVGRGHIFVTRHGDKRLAQLPRHVFDKAGFAAAGGAFQHHRHTHGVGGFVEFDFIGNGAVVRFFLDHVIRQIARRCAGLVGRRTHGSTAGISRRARLGLCLGARQRLLAGRVGSHESVVTHDRYLLWV